MEPPYIIKKWIPFLKQILRKYKKKPKKTAFLGKFFQTCDLNAQNLNTCKLITRKIFLFIIKYLLFF